MTLQKSMSLYTLTNTTTVPSSDYSAVAADISGTLETLQEIMANPDYQLSQPYVDDVTRFLSAAYRDLVKQMSTSPITPALQSATQQLSNSFESFTSYMSSSSSSFTLSSDVSSVLTGSMAEGTALNDLASQSVLPDSEFWN